VRGIVALRSGYRGQRSKALDEVLRPGLQDSAAAARTALSARFTDAEVTVVNRAPMGAILTEAGRSRADIIALGWRGYGTFRRLLAGSVSRTVAARAEASVLVARSTPKTVRRFLVGFDDSANAHHAISLLSRLQPVRGSRAILVNVMDDIELPRRASRLPASLRAQLRADLAAMDEKQRQQAQQALKAAARELQRAGWTTEEEIRKGPALASLLNAARSHRADVLVLGARATSGLQRVLVGSVAEGALERSAKTVLLVR
jgi:nucleotide-binding universal stress UspA family protein